MEELVVDSSSNLEDTFLHLSLEEENQLQKKVAHLLFEIKECKNNVHLLEAEHRKMETSINTLLCQINRLDARKIDVLDKTKQLHRKIDERHCGDTVKDLFRMFKLVKDLEGKESDLSCASESIHDAEDLEGKESDLSCASESIHDAEDHEEKESDLSCASESIHDAAEQSVTCEAQPGFPEFDQTLCQTMNQLASAKRELAAKLRAVLSVKRKIGDVPAQVELIQYERRFSELYSQIREKHTQTSKLYGTYNSLLEIKELMLKETSLLNSINSQFQDALASTIGRSKLVESMEVIVKGTQQKLEKVQHSLLAEKKISDSLREKYIAAVADHRHFSFLLKAFQDECTKHERLRLEV